MSKPSPTPIGATIQITSAPGVQSGAQAVVIECTVCEPGRCRFTHAEPLIGPAAEWLLFSHEFEIVST